MIKELGDKEHREPFLTREDWFADDKIDSEVCLGEFDTLCNCWHSVADPGCFFPEFWVNCPKAGKIGFDWILRSALCFDLEHLLRSEG